MPKEKLNLNLRQRWELYCFLCSETRLMNFNGYLNCTGRSSDYPYLYDLIRKLQGTDFSRENPVLNYDEIYDACLELIQYLASDNFNPNDPPDIQELLTEYEKSADEKLRLKISKIIVKIFAQYAALATLGAKEPNELQLQAQAILFEIQTILIRNDYVIEKGELSDHVLKSITDSWRAMRVIEPGLVAGFFSYGLGEYYAFPFFELKYF